ncbi:MAG: glycoside hydrolase family 2 TIM barrel-domain containing protein [Luteolibacter sp.]
MHRPFLSSFRYGAAGIIAATFSWSSLIAHAESIRVFPVQETGWTRSLNGEWFFKYIPSLDAGPDEGFSEPSFDVSAWKKISVPSNWEMQGFAEPKYDMKSDPGLGLYRRALHVPKEWRDGRRVCLRFEGVINGFEARVNGKKIGQSQGSAYTPDTFDITDELAEDHSAENVLAVKVSTRSPGWEYDMCDDWSLSGIFRDVTLFSVPALHVKDLTAISRVAPDGSAELSAKVEMNGPQAEVRGKLTAPDGTTVEEFDLTKENDVSHQTLVKLPKPRLWTAETPFLYTLRITVSDKGRPFQSIEQRIGIREISTEGGILKLNGRPIKLRGVNRHDLNPEVGRAVTEEMIRRDLEVMKRANINFVRTAHYPSHPSLMRLCDEMGFYVMCEVSFGKRGRHLKGAEYDENILSRVEPTITRDKNHASVISWSIGNENATKPVEQEAGRRAKELDPTRPICIPKTAPEFVKCYKEIEAHSDINAPHYPSNAELREFEKNLTKPLILTEYAHALGLATDRIQDQWEMLQTIPKFAGGAIWHFQDQGILRTSSDKVNRKKSTKSVWLDETRYYDTSGDDGADGIVYSDRSPQTDFWQVRKVYSPIQIVERRADVKVGERKVSVTLENRYDFISLAGAKLQWSFQRNGTKQAKGEIVLSAEAQKRETVEIPVNIPQDFGTDVFTLDLACLDHTGLQITERTIRLDVAGQERDSWVKELASSGKTTVEDTATRVKIQNDRWTIRVERSNGEFTLTDRSGRTLISAIYPRCGRELTMTEGYTSRKVGTWKMATLSKVLNPEVKVSEQGDRIQLSVSGTYPRPDEEGQSFVGGYRLEISATGVMTVSYRYVPTDAKGSLAEAGLTVVVPEDLTEFRWIGQGPYASYPGKDRLNEFGIFHLNREDLRFRGNRRQTELALLSTPAGEGLAMTSTPADISVERDGNRTSFSHNAVIGSLGNKIWAPETTVEVSRSPTIEGTFSLLPLDATWPQAFVNWFGEPSASEEAYHPFYHSYDQ